MSRFRQWSRATRNASLSGRPLFPTKVFYFLSASAKSPNHSVINEEIYMAEKSACRTFALQFSVGYTRPSRSSSPLARRHFLARHDQRARRCSKPVIMQSFSRLVRNATFCVPLAAAAARAQFDQLIDSGLLSPTSEKCNDSRRTADW
jgi:hypothetical protein